MSDSGMYMDDILDYYKHPRNYGTIKDADASVKDMNPLCGDEIQVDLKIRNNAIQDIKFSGHGCAISQASVSMLTEFVSGKSLDKIKSLAKNDVLNLIGIEVSAVRMKCALLGLKVLKVAAYSYLGEKMKDEEKNEL